MLHYATIIYLDLFYFCSIPFPFITSGLGLQLLHGLLELLDELLEVLELLLCYDFAFRA